MRERAARLATVRSAVGLGRGGANSSNISLRSSRRRVGVQKARTKTRLSWCLNSRNKELAHVGRGLVICRAYSWQTPFPKQSHVTCYTPHAGSMLAAYPPPRRR